MDRKISLEIPADIKLEDSPELYAAFIRQIEKYQMSQPDRDTFLDIWTQALNRTRAATLAARELVRIYWEPVSKIDAERNLRRWFENRPKFDPYQEAVFTWGLIEFAGRRALKEGVSRRTSDAAKSKNAKPREWVRNEWASRSDKGQSKASFARQYAPLVKKRFGVDVTPEQISRVWLPKG